MPICCDAALKLENYVSCEDSKSLRIWFANMPKEQVADKNIGRFVYARISKYKMSKKFALQKTSNKYSLSDALILTKNI